MVGLARASGNARFAYDSYRRFIQMYGDVVLGVPFSRFEHLLAAKRLTTGAKTDAELPEATLRKLVEEYKSLVRAQTGQDFPMDPTVQLWGAIEAVWRSWTLKKAVDYRRVNSISETLGTGREHRVDGVRQPRRRLGHWRRVHAQSVDRRDESSTASSSSTRRAKTSSPAFARRSSIDDMSTHLPEAYAELRETEERLERHFRDMQDIEFTVERGRLFLLQTRNGKRTAAAAVRIATQMVDEGLIDSRTAVQRVAPEQLDQLLHPVIDAGVRATPLCIGLPASPGAASGIAVFDPDVAEQRAHAGQQVILVRDETTPEDFHGIVAARAVLTARGGMTSHAAVVARGMGKCAVVGCKDIHVDVEHRRFKVGDETIAEGDWITVDGATGRVYRGDLPTTPSEIVQVIRGTRAARSAPDYQAFARLLGWADDVRRLKVRANADTPHDARIARGFGAEGIGLCRTEHMFFEGDRIHPMREMIVARDEGGRRRALNKLLPMQRMDFEGIFEAMNGLPVTIRLLDPPLHEFLPHGGEEIKAARAYAGSGAS